MATLLPMLATRAPITSVRGEGWAHEFKWDGVRVLAEVTPGVGVRLRARRGNDISGRYPETDVLADRLVAPAVLDGEIVAFDSDRRPSFHRLQSRMHLQSPGRIAEAMQRVPVVFVVFDVLAADGEVLLDTPYERRREILTDLSIDGGRIEVPAHHVDSLDPMLQVAAQHGLEGVVAKRLGSAYRPGERSADWVKVRIMRRQEFVVVGYQRGRGGRSLGSLLLAVHDDEGILRHVGSVGSGLRDHDLAAWQERLDAAAVASPAFVHDGLDEDGCVFSAPNHVAEVRFAQWSPDGRLRQPTYLGERLDVDVQDVVREP